MSLPAIERAPNVTPYEIDEMIPVLAKGAGFSQAGIAPVPPAGEGYAELEQFAPWIERGYAGEMEYLKRRDEESRLLRSSLRIPFPWARSVIVCAANYQAEEVKSTDPAPAEAGWIARYAWTGYRPAPGEPSAPQPAMEPSDYHTVLLGRLKRLEQDLQQRLGPFDSRCYVDTGPVVERVYAKYAGI
ncbi:MAG TPA: QueG-associated DUF1730 domain-containing protein, partial [Acidobacteriaceae bacterium]|nr:QueG-associated DUF1730 domain-containing protein [Acidobacteriaceae bacterium]